MYFWVLRTFGGGGREPVECSHVCRKHKHALRRLPSRLTRSSDLYLLSRAQNQGG